MGSSLILGIGFCLFVIFQGGGVWGELQQCLSTCYTQESKTLSQGPPGKRGPSGPSGPKGEPGHCSKSACEDIQYFTKIVCEGATSVVSCPTGKVIRILPNSVIYGRLVPGSVTCHTDLDRDRNCGRFGGNSNVKLEGFCNNKNRCNALASNRIYGDPCPGTVKYLQFIYKCV